jgi:hypothetical protein
MVLGAVLWGNSHGIKMLDFTFNFLLKHGIELRIYSGKMFDDFSNNANLGHWTTCPPVTPACSTLNGFVNFFGLTIFIYLALGYFVARGIRKYSSVTRSLSLIASLLWASTHAFLWSYGSPLMIDYWILSRLLEIPVYFVVIVFVLFLIELDEHNQFIVNVFLLLIWLWVLVPITSLSIIPQFTHNFRFFFAQF